jgi:hypothetical protein
MEVELGCRTPEMKVVLRHLKQRYSGVEDCSTILDRMKNVKMKGESNVASIKSKVDNLYRSSLCNIQGYVTLVFITSSWMSKRTRINGQNFRSCVMTTLLTLDIWTSVRK